jgi:ABC-type transport system substrate-binding protein
MDMPLYKSLGLILDYNVSRAEEFLDAAGFTVGLDGWRIDPYTGVKMDPLKYYIRMDDPNRMRAGQMHVEALQAAGIPVNAIITERTVCYKNVMVLYDYHLYTGGWSLSTTPDQYHDLYSSYTYYGPSVGWSNNYPGFCNHEFDDWAKKVKYPATIPEAQEAAKKCGEIFLNMSAIAPMWSSAAVKAYKTGWLGVVNNAFFGIDNGYSFLNMHKTGDNVIDWGFKSDIETLNIVTSEWLWDINVLGQIYDGMIGTNPFNAAPTEWFLATACAVTSWSAPGGDPDATVLTWTVNTNALWHNGQNLTRDDVKFSIEFNKKCGAGVSWNYPLVSDVYDVALGPGAKQVTVRMKHKSAWAFQWIGGLPIIKKSIWELNIDSEGKDWTDPDWDTMCVRKYDPVKQDLDGIGGFDIFQDGTGPWKFNSYVMGNYVLLDANTNFYRTQDDISGRLKTMFHYGAGDADESGSIGVVDMGMLQFAFGTSGDPNSLPDMTPPYTYGVYNSACDLNKDGTVDIDDMGVAGMNYGGTMG